MELSPICKKVTGAAGTVSQRVPGSGAYATLSLLRPAKKGASGDFGAAHRRRLCRADDRHLCPRATPCSTTLPWSRTAALWDLAPVRCPSCSSVIPIGRWCWRWSRRIIRHPTPGSGNGGWISMPKTAFSPATCRYGCAAWHWMCSRPAGRHWILPPIKGFIARSLAVWRPFLCKSANKTPPGQILLVFWPGVV